MFYLICVWINGWVNNREAGDLRRHLGHYDVSVMITRLSVTWVTCSSNQNGLGCHCNNNCLPSHCWDVIRKNEYIFFYVSQNKFNAQGLSKRDCGNTSKRWKQKIVNLTTLSLRHLMVPSWWKNLKLTIFVLCSEPIWVRNTSFSVTLNFISPARYYATECSVNIDWLLCWVSDIQRSLDISQTFTNQC